MFDHTETDITDIKYGIKIDITDFNPTFNYEKVDEDGNTTFHLMAQDHDLDIIEYSDILKNVLKIKNKGGQNIDDIAKASDFIPLLSMIYQDKKLYAYDEKESCNVHILAKDKHIKKQSGILNSHGFSITINDARLGINYFKIINSKGNSFLQILIKKYIHDSSNKQLFKDIKYILQLSSDNNYLNFTAREDGNTPLRLAAIACNSQIVDALFTRPDILPLKPNSFGKTPLEIAKFLNNDFIQNLRKQTEHRIRDYDNLIQELFNSEVNILNTSINFDFPTKQKFNKLQLSYLSSLIDEVEVYPPKDIKNKTAKTLLTKNEINGYKIKE